MRFLIFTLSLLICGSVYASGKLQIEPYWKNTTGGESGSRIGFVIYEKIWGPLYWNSYTGMGLLRDDHSKHQVDWALFKNGLVFHVNRMLQLEAGVRFNKGDKHNLTEGWQEEAYVKMGVQLW